MTLLPVGTLVKYNEEWHQRKRIKRGAGYSPSERDRHAKWESQERAERWTIVAHIQPGEPYNASLQPIYKLVRVTDGSVSYSYPNVWEVA